MPLEHVQRHYDGIGYEYVTVEEAIKDYPEGVSAEEGIFVCGLCDEPVILAHGDERTYFRHSNKSNDKECEDRSANSSFSQSFSVTSLIERQSPKQRYVKIKIVNSENEDPVFLFCLGFSPLPEDLREKLSGIKLTIKTSIDDQGIFGPYNLDDRIKEEGVTYLPPSFPVADEYMLSFDYRSPQTPETFKRIHNILTTKYWSKKINVLCKDKMGKFKFAVFDKLSGRLLTSNQYPSNDEIIVNRDYYVVANKELPFLQAIGTRINTSRRFNNDNYFLYIIRCRDFKKESCLPIEKLGLKLREIPSLLFPIWPPYVNKKTMISHNCSSTYLFMKGRALFKTFPRNKKWTTDDLKLNTNLTLDHNVLLEVPSEGGEQYFTIGRGGEAIKQFFFRRADISSLATEADSTVKIVSENEEELTKEIYYETPPKFLRIYVSYNGVLKIEESGRVVESYELKANKPFSKHNLKLGQKLVVYQGFDVVRTITFEKSPPPVKHSATSINDIELRKRLEHSSGELVPVPHVYGALCSKMASYPLVKAWLFKAIRAKYASKKALKIIETFFAQ